MEFSRLIWRTLAVVLSLLLVVSCFAQDCNRASVDVGANCANIIVEIKGITSQRIEGQIDSKDDLPVVVTVYKSSKADRKKSAYAAAVTLNRVVSFESDKNDLAGIVTVRTVPG
jgi:hypothetical protein